MDSPGKRIKKLREQFNLGQEDLAKKLDKSSKQTISNWENDRSEPTISDYRKLAEIFGTTVAFLIGEAGNVQEQKSDMIYISKDEFIELQRKALKSEEEKNKELSQKIKELKND